jgi:hypothetical protein
MAARFWVSGGNGNINSTTNWSATSGGASGASVPTSTDDVTFDANGNSNATVNVTATWLSLTITSGYTATITHNATLTINGNITFGANYNIAGGSQITSSGTSTITSNGKTWPNNFGMVGSVTRTLVGDLVISGTLTCSGGTITVNKTTSETLTINGFTAGTNVGCGGTAEIIFVGGTWTTTGNNIGISNPISIAGNLIISGNIFISSTTLMYLSGAVTTTSSTIQINANCTLDVNGISWNNVIFSSGATHTITINSPLLILGDLSILQNQNVAFTGTDGFTCSTFSSPSITARTVTLQEGITYTITSALTANTSRVGSILTFTSSHASNKAILTLQNPASCNVLANFTRIDASNGRTITTFNGTITDCLNILEFHDLPTSSHAL